MDQKTGEELQRKKHVGRLQRYAVAAALVLAILALWFHDIWLPAIQP